MITHGAVQRISPLFSLKSKSGQIPLLRSRCNDIKPFVYQSTQSTSSDDKIFIPGPDKSSTWWPHQPINRESRVVKLYPVRFRHKTRISLVREGCANRPFYTIQVKSNLAEPKRPGIEQVGSWDPLPNIHGEQLIALNFERISYWLGMGAEPTTRVAELLGLCGFLPIHPRSYLMAYRSRIEMIKYLEKQKQAEKHEEETTSETELNSTKETEESETKEPDIHSRVDSIWCKRDKPSSWWFYGLP
ncbi:unnamed protein product [Heterobilharzia americana]|nr:unnamed protein product [Heterobilharzia americana]CAH8568449.1 unnamed protein product [Heterobilharzia americana]